MNTRTHTALSVALAALVFGLVVPIARPAATAAQAPVDRTGLDILCSGKGDTYSPPVKGVSSCIFADGQVLVCDSANDKCYEGKAPKQQARILGDAMTLRLLKQLNDKVDALTAQVRSLTAAGKK